MIPYFESPKYVLGPFTLETFGIFAALGIYVGARIAAGRAARAGLDGKPLVDFAFWGVISGVIFGHPHPSGQCEPSRADEFLTQTLKSALSLVDVRVLDHMVVSGSTCTSFGLSPRPPR